jgi:ribonuclease VapC
MSEIYVLDSSALLCLFAQEPGADVVAGKLKNAVISAVNYAEVVGKLVERSADPQATAHFLGSLELNVVDYTQAQAFQSGAFRQLTKSAGLSLGDRACLAVAAERNAIALTSDKAWQRVSVGVKVQLVR